MHHSRLRANKTATASHTKQNSSDNSIRYKPTCEGSTGVRKPPLQLLIVHQVIQPVIAMHHGRLAANTPATASHIEEPQKNSSMP
jgi:hypothetical protein